MNDATIIKELSTRKELPTVYSVVSEFRIGYEQARRCLSAMEPKPVTERPMLTVRHGCCLAELPKIAAGSVHCVVTSPPYYNLRAYGIPPSDWPEITFVPVAGLPPLTVAATRCVFGEEPEPWAYIAHLVHVFRLVRETMRDDATLFLNLGDSYADDTKWGGASGGKHVTALHGNTGIGRNRKASDLKPKDLVGIPERARLALQADGWYWRSRAPWIKRNPMPESVNGIRWERCRVKVSGGNRGKETGRVELAEASGLNIHSDHDGKNW